MLIRYRNYDESCGSARNPRSSLRGRRRHRQNRQRFTCSARSFQGRTTDDAAIWAVKIAGSRIFDNDNGKMNLSVVDVKGAVLVISQFTLSGDVYRGNRPSFDDAAPPRQAKELYEYFVEKIRATCVICETGRFQSTMQVELVNDGPVTILLDSAKTWAAFDDRAWSRKQSRRARRAANRFRQKVNRCCACVRAKQALRQRSHS